MCCSDMHVSRCLVCVNHRADARKVAADFEARSMNAVHSGTTTSTKDSESVLVEKKAQRSVKKSALSLMMQRRQNSFRHRTEISPLVILKERTKNNQNWTSNVPQAIESDHQWAASTRSALLRALDRYDSNLHGRALASFCGDGNKRKSTSVSPEHKPGLASNINLPILNYIESPVETLGISDVPKLLAEYKSLAKICSVLVSEKTEYLS